MDAWRRLNGVDRLAGIDLARGLAVIGMFAAHLLWIDTWDWSRPQTWADVANGRPSILFATLAGVSIGLMSGGRRPVSGSALATVRGRLAIRAGLIWAIGILLVLTGVPIFVILPAYGILFLLALPVLPLTARQLLTLAGALALVLPFLQVVLNALPFWQTEPGVVVAIAIGWHYPFTTWVVFLLCGLGLARLDLRSAGVQALLLGAGVVLTLVGYGTDAVLGEPAASVPSPWAQVWTARAHSSGLLEVIGSGGFAIAVIALCLLACRTWLRWAAVPLRAVGSMPLTAYAAQIVVWALIAVSVLGDPGDLAGFRDLAPFWPLMLSTVVACTLWALVAGRGPLEWAVDRITRLVLPDAPSRR